MLKGGLLVGPWTRADLPRWTPPEKPATANSPPSLTPTPRSSPPPMASPPPVLDHLTAAAEHARSTPVISSWLAATEATIHADRGDHQLARDALIRARTELDKPAQHRAAEWFYEYPGQHLAAATGHTLLRAGDHHGARNTIAMALDKLRATARRQRALLLVDLATAELHTGNLPDACARATQSPTPKPLRHRVRPTSGLPRCRSVAHEQPCPTRTRRTPAPPGRLIKQHAPSRSRSRDDLRCGVDAALRCDPNPPR
jgi:hypothetical protein